MTKRLRHYLFVTLLCTSAAAAGQLRMLVDPTAMPASSRMPEFSSFIYDGKVWYGKLPSGSPMSELWVHNIELGTSYKVAEVNPGVNRFDLRPAAVVAGKIVFHSFDQNPGIQKPIFYDLATNQFQFVTALDAHTYQSIRFDVAFAIGGDTICTACQTVVNAQVGIRTCLLDVKNRTIRTLLLPNTIQPQEQLSEKAARIGKYIYMGGFHRTWGAQLYRFDVEADTIGPAGAVNPLPFGSRVYASPHAFNGKVFFATADTALGGSASLWEYSPQTRQYRRITHEASVTMQEIFTFYLFHSELFFTVMGRRDHVERETYLMRYDAASDRAQLTFAFTPDQASPGGAPHFPVIARGRDLLFFNVSSQDSIPGPWFNHSVMAYSRQSRSVIRPSLTQQVPQQGASELIADGDTLYFDYFSYDEGQEIFRWRPNQGQQLFVSVAPGPQPSFPSDMQFYDGALYFWAYNPAAVQAGAPCLFEYRAYSNPRSITSNEAQATARRELLRVSPNPTRGEVQIAAEGLEGGTVSYALVAADGRVIAEASAQPVEGLSSTVSEALRTAVPGIYVLRLTTPGTSLTTRLVRLP